jgi:hypothetical protein
VVGGRRGTDPPAPARGLRNPLRHVSEHAALKRPPGGSLGQ